VALAPTHWRRGLGKAVVKALFEVGQALNCKEAWVLTDRGNPSAMAFYSSMGGAEGVGGAGPDNPVVGYTFALGAS